MNKTQFLAGMASIIFIPGLAFMFGAFAFPVSHAC